MRRRRRGSRRIWLLPLVILAFAGVVFYAPNVALGVPESARGKVTDAYTGQPLSGVTVSANGKSTTTQPDGSFELFGVPKETTLTFHAEGYAAVDSDLKAVSAVQLRPRFLSGAVRGVDGKPVAGATLVSSAGLAQTGQAGEFRLANVQPNTPVVVKAPGYEKLEFFSGMDSSADIQLKRQDIKAIYMSAAVLETDEEREALLQKLEGTEINAIVIDVKGDRGQLTYNSRVPLARQIGATPKTDIGLQTTLARLKRGNIYTIARIVTFKDRALAQGMPDFAVRHKVTGRPFVDPEGQNWVDPFRPEVWDYNVNIAVEAAQLGFDEIQFDYIRFPSDGQIEFAQYSKPTNAESRRTAINEFLKRASDRIRPTEAFLSVDIFGYAVWTEHEQGIGQQIEQMAGLVDYLSPMLYPSTFGAGIPGSIDRDTGIRDPYQIIKRSLDQAKKRTGVDGPRFRPWLQYFDDYYWQTGKKYTALEVNEQKRATLETGASGWMLWDPENLYNRGGIASRSAGAVRR